MNLCDFSKTFEVSWLAAHSREELLECIEATRGGDQRVRLMFIGTQMSRVYIVARGGEAEFVPFSYSVGLWAPLFKHQWKVDAWDVRCLKSDETFYGKLERQMLLQFSHCATGYYDIPPRKSDVLSVLKEGDTVYDLDTFRFSNYTVEVQEDPEWDGAVQVICDEGVLLIPYVGEDQRLVLKYATWQADTITSKFTGAISGGFDRVFSFFGNLHWSDVRYRINRIGGTKQHGKAEN